MHSATLAPDEVTTRRGIPVTTPARTLLDLAARLSALDLARAAHEAEGLPRPRVNAQARAAAASRDRG
jgi:hypothetical protein